jgi:ubiquinone/menaquinone biosynthesis C-methylase UbiE
VGDTFLDLGCGAGDYCFHAAKSVGEAGTVYAVDLYQSIVDDVSRNAREQGIPNIYPVVSDISKHIDVADDMIDTCLVATVLHTIRISAKKTNLFSEIHRVLKPGGKLAIIECKGNEGPSGPPPTSRILPEELEKDCARYGFVRTGYVDLGPTYMMVFAVDD